MSLCFAFVLSLLACQGDGAIPPSPYDRVYTLELTAEDPLLIDGRGPTAVVELEVEFTGTLHLWTRSELDLLLRVVDASDDRLLAEDDDSGGGDVPYVARSVATGDRLAVLVASADDGASGTLELHAVAAPETAATLEAARLADEGLDEARRLLQEGDRDATRSRIEELLERLASTSEAEHSEAVAEARWDLGDLAWAAEAPGSARRAWGAARKHFGRARPAGHSDLLGTTQNLAFAAAAMGDLAGARALEESVLAARERTLPHDHPDLLAARQNLAATMKEQGDLAGARALLESVLAARERTLPEGHLDLLTARMNLAVTSKAMGDALEALALEESVVTDCETALPPDHPFLLLARQNLARTLFGRGDLRDARALQESVLAARERALPPDHPELLDSRADLANTLAEAGDLVGARALQESVLEAVERTLPEDHPDLVAARADLAVTMSRQGDLAGARALEELVLAARERTLPADHRDLLRARANLAGTMLQQGDHPGARALQESVLAARERTLPPDHPDLFRARNNLAATMLLQDDSRGASALLESALADMESTLTADHGDVLHARQNLALTLKRRGDLSGARRLQESLAAAFERTLDEDHPALLAARANLAATMSDQGDLAGARALEESVVAAFERTLPPDHPDLLSALGNLASTKFAQGDASGAYALLGQEVRGLRALVLASLALAPRQAREAVGSATADLAAVLFLSRDAGPGLRASVFELQETMRMVTGETARALLASGDEEVRSLLDEAGETRSALGDLISSSPAERDAAAFSAELTRLMRQRDRLERVASRLLSERGVATRPIELAPLARALAGSAALVTYNRVALWLEGEEGGPREELDRVLAHVLAADGSLARLDLGEAAELEGLVMAWRRALGRPLRGRGVAPAQERAPADARAAGETLRRRLVDPILSALDEEADTLHVCADDLVFLVPLDALPLEDGVLGDRYRFVNEVSCARLVDPELPFEPGQGLLALGGVDYDAGSEAESTEAKENAARSATPGAFSRLSQTRSEAEATGTLCEGLLEVEPVVLTGGDATKEALFEQAAGKRYLHLATHGWFADEALRSTLDEQPGERGWSPTGVDERVTRMAPMLLCGLALAGANLPVDPLGRRPGILTAEELCALDLRACELAVLSACETNVGVRRAGQGIQSLQAALYAAGARSSITSLWKVDDAATRKLFELFYTYLWEDGLPKAEALWKAKRALRGDGAPVRDWAAWVLTGDPE